MRYAIVSDLHANRQAWNSVLLDIRNIGVDSIICLGDIIGYGPSPVEVFESAYSNINHFVLGNHDAVVCGKMSANQFNEKARNLILWTHSQLNKNAIKFLQSLPLTLNAGEFRCCHSEFSRPAAYNYIIDPEDAMASWRSVDNNLLFIGHTHVPGIFLLGKSGTPHLVKPQDFELEPGKRYLINVGSVGQPRDADTRASYCIYDSDKKHILWRRIPFDIDAYRKDMLNASLDPSTTWFLAHDPRNTTPPLRDILVNFSPAKTEEETAQNTVEVQELSELRHSRKRWKLLAVILSVLAIILMTFSAILLVRQKNRSLTIHGLIPAAISASSAPVNKNILSMPETIIPPASTIDNWIIQLDNKYKQSVETTNTNDGIAFLLKSKDAENEISILSPPILVKPGMRICISGLFRKNDNFHGNIAIALSLTKQKNGKESIIQQFLYKEPYRKRKNNWQEARITENIPADSTKVQFKIIGKFTGEVLMRNLRLERKTRKNKERN